MLHITDGRITLEVTKGAFKSIYSNRGFKPLDDTRSDEEEGLVTNQPDLSSEFSDDSTQQEDDEEDLEEPEFDDDLEEPEDLSEIPLGEMGFDQLSEYADQLNIDHHGVRSKKELRAMIRQHLKG